MDMLSNLGWRSLENRRIDMRLAMFYKMVYVLVAVPPRHILSILKFTFATWTLFVTDRFKHQSVTTKKTFSSISIVLWNRLPADPVLVPDLDSFNLTLLSLIFLTNTPCACKHPNNTQKRVRVYKEINR